MDGNTVCRTIRRIANEIIERNDAVKDLCFLGIQRGGVYLAEKIISEIADIENIKLPIGTLDITLYRDDIGLKEEQSVIKMTDIPFDITGKKIILVDDVIFTGRTIRAALDEIIDFGRPASIQLAVLIDRGGKEFPICADYVGRKISAEKDESVRVLMKQAGGEDKVVLRYD